MRFWVPWGIDALIGAVALPAVVLGGSLWLRAAGRRGLALALALVLAVPAVLAVVLGLLLLLSHPRWN